MKVFISWSKEPSKTVAKTLKDWLPSVIQALDPWMSDEDIQAGSRWNSEISKQLATTSFGIICVTPQNQHEPWIQFEAGALAKTVETQLNKEPGADESYVVPYLINMAKRDLSGPLTAFQAVEADEVGTKKLVTDVNKALEAHGGKALPEATLNKSFERAWPDLKSVLAELPTPTTTKPKRESEDVLGEILEVVRDTNRRLGETEAKGETYSDSIRWLPASAAPNRIKQGKIYGLATSQVLSNPPPVEFTNKATFVLRGKGEAIKKFQEVMDKPLFDMMDAVEKSALDAIDEPTLLLLGIESMSDEKFDKAKILIHRVAKSLEIQIEAL
jgi:hypothetical protein